MRRRDGTGLATLTAIVALSAAGLRAQPAPQVPPPPVPSQSAPPERHEPGLPDRERRHARSTASEIGLLPARLLRLPFQIVNYPVEHYLIHKEPGAITVYTGRFVRRINTEGLYVRIGGLGSGSGTGPGLRYEIAPWTGGPQLQFLAATTYSGYDLVSARLDSIRTGGPTFGLALQYAERPREDFFGLGSHSRLEDQATYQIDEWRGQLETGVRRRGWQATATFAVCRDDVGRGRDPDHPSVEQLFDASLFEGLRGRFEFFEYGAHLRFDSRDVPRYARRGTYLEAGFDAADGTGGAPHGYTKYQFEIAQFVPLPGWRRSLAGRLRAVFTDDRSATGLPIFRLERLGGSRSVRGYDTHRFHDEESLLGNLEYRFPIWAIGLSRGQALDGVVFFDFGAAVHDLSDLRQSDLRSSAGIGARAVTVSDLILRVDNAWTPEGFRTHLGLRGTF